MDTFWEYLFFPLLDMEVSNNSAKLEEAVQALDKYRRRLQILTKLKELQKFLEQKERTEDIETQLEEANEMLLLAEKRVELLQRAKRLTLQVQALRSVPVAAPAVTVTIFL